MYGAEVEFWPLVEIGLALGFGWYLGKSLVVGALSLVNKLLGGD